MIKKIVLLTVFISFVASANEDSYTKWGDYNQYTVPLFALGMSLFHKDYEATGSVAKSYGTAMVAMWSTKFAVKRKRPNGGKYSFPSGHTTSAFSGVNHLRIKYGYYYFIPAFVLATSVAHSRVEGNFHYTTDVIAGAFLAMLCDQFFTKKTSIEVIPIIEPDKKAVMFIKRF